MKYCSKCGKELVDEAVICIGCGCPTEKLNEPAVKDAPSIGWAFLGFFIPLAGLILYLVGKDTTPMKAKSAGKGALIGFIVSIVLSILYFVFMIMLMVISIESSVSYYAI